MSPRASAYSSSLAQPSSPLAPRMDSLNVPTTQRHRPSRQHSSTSGSLRLPSLPRFHPANFPSQHTSATATPVTGPSSPQPPVSPRTQQKQYSDAQKQLYLYQREFLNGNGLGRTSSATSNKPVSPRLIPIGSPGPVTPLELEGQSGSGGGGYLMVGSRASASLTGDYVEKLIQEEAKRMATQSTPRPSSSVGGH